MKHLILLILVSLLFVGCQTGHDSDKASLDRWILPAEFRSVDSYEQLPEVFREYNGRVFVQSINVNEAEYALVKLLANNGSSLFSCMVYEKVELKLWQLRGCFWFYFSRTGEISVEKEGDGFYLIHDGKRLFQITSAAEQVQRLLKSNG